uniref:carbohydrate porin n=1 Tax=Synechococcus sp. N5 TaxID=2575515 RepID=UPI0010BD6265
KGVADFIIGGVSVDDQAPAVGEALTFQYRYRLNLNTSFTGEDLLYARLQSATGGGWTEANATHLSDSGDQGASVEIDKLWYTFPVGDFTFTVGPAVENYYMIETPTRYKPVLKAFKLGGYGAVLGASTGAGAGVQWRQNVERGDAAFNFAVNYTNNDAADSARGLFGDGTGSSLVTQVGYGTRKLWGGIHYSRKGLEAGAYPTDGQSNIGTVNNAMNAWGLRGFYVADSKAMPTISGGVDFGSVAGEIDGDTTSTFGYMVGLNWDDVFVEGNKAGLAYGSIGSYVTDTQGTANVDNDNSALELWYQYQVTDNISIKPAVFWTNNYANDDDDTFGALVQTTFKF